MSGAAADRGRIRASALREELAALTEVVDGPALVDLLLERSFEMRATDIHMDPQETNLRVRVRVDGMLHDAVEIPTQLGLQMISRLKLMGNMDIAEKRLPQDGHFTQERANLKRDVRVASAPTPLGERLVLRLLPELQEFTQFADLGMNDAEVALIEEFLNVPYGMILSVGPVGCGKTTTMYNALQSLNLPSKSLATIEDPIEHRIPRVNQLQVERRIDFGFVRGLRALLRQDPNVLMVGEIRDAETAHIAVRAGLTGVVVLSTMHANDASASIDVFREFELPAMLLADALVGVMSQRLVRKVCPECRESYSPSEAACQALELDPSSSPTLVRGKGCDACFGSGYRGRTGVFEIMRVDGPVRKGVLQGASRAEIRDLAVQQGMVPLYNSAAAKVRDGTTTFEEMQRVLAAFPHE